ncbi:hypothetical protein [Aureivirga marina]|uniref:hypothetical protein n=1 Tax=Aureivirga marina TaxID=1182451 RepID=UPI0018CB04DC|nr:hypothetical protein [Aureivirga marina]
MEKILLFVSCFLISFITFSQQTIKSIEKDIAGNWKHQEKNVIVNFSGDDIMKTTYNDIHDIDTYDIEENNEGNFFLHVFLSGTDESLLYKLILKDDVLTLIPENLSDNPKPDIYKRIKS